MLQQQPTMLTIPGAGQNDDAAKSVAERRMAKRKALIQEHIEVVDRAIAARKVKDEREALVEVAAGLRRLEAELDAAAEDAEAWAAAHPPRKMPEATVAKYREAAERAADYVLKMRRFPTGYDERVVWKKDFSAGLVVREYEANGFVEIFDNEDFGLPRHYLNLLVQAPRLLPIDMH